MAIPLGIGHRVGMKRKKAILGAALKSLRVRNGWSLADVSRRTNIAISTLSKVENGQLSLTYDKLIALSEGLAVDVSYFFGGGFSVPEAVEATTRRSVDPTGGKPIDTPNYTYRYLNTELSRKRMVPIIVEHRAKSLEEFGPLVHHSGEEFLYVLEGRLEVHTEHYTPVTLEPGQSIYIDSGMGHAYLAAGSGPCRTLAVCTAPEAEINDAVQRHAKEAPEQNEQPESRVVSGKR